MDDIEENVHGLDGATISLYQNDPEHAWTVAYPSHGAMARYGNYDSFSDDSSRSQSERMGGGGGGVSHLFEERKTEATGLLTTSSVAGATAKTTTTKTLNESNKVNMDELPGLY